MSQFEKRQAKKRRRAAVRNATATRRTVSVVNVADTESSYTSETCTDEDTVTGMLSVSPEEVPEQTDSDSGDEMLLAIIARLFQVEAELSSTREELAKTSDELSQVKSELQTTNDQLAEAQAELAEEKKVNVQLQSENSELVVSEQILSEDDKMVKYYTGLPSYDLLKAIYGLVIADIPTGLFSGCSCSPFQQFLIVLMKLHLNLGDQDMAYRFGIHQSTISRYFNKWLDILYHKLSVFVSWPEREELLRTTPVDFRKDFGKCAIIVDCFEIFIERPTSLMARAQTWPTTRNITL